MKKTTHKKPTPTAPLTIRKLDTIEDEGVQEALGRLARADQVAPDYVLSGAIMDTTLADVWARLDEDVNRLTATKGEFTDEDDRVSLLSAHREWAYWIGLAVGLRLAPLQTAASMSQPRRHAIGGAQ